MLRYETDDLALHFYESKGQLDLLFRGKKVLTTNRLFVLETIYNEKKQIFDGSDIKPQIITATADTLQLNWQGDGVTVRTTAEVRNNKIYMTAGAQVKDGAVIRLYYPLFTAADSIGNTPLQDKLVVPWQGGFVVENPAKHLIARQSDQVFWAGRGVKKYENDYPAQLSFQFLYWYSDAGGMYMAAEDKDAWFKTFGLYSQSDTVFDISIIHYPENSRLTSCYDMAYPVVFKGLPGDWQTAAEEYRQFAVKQKWCSKGKLSQRKVNANVYKVDLWRINHRHMDCGRDYEQYKDTTFKLRQKTGAKLGLHWYGWNKGIHDVNYPEYISRDIRETAIPELKACNRVLDEAGVIKIPYVNARIWDKNGPHFEEENAQAAVIIDEDGRIPDEPWNDAAKLVPMCPAAVKWQDKVAEFAKEYFDCGFNGLYLDQIGSFFATRCYNPSHGHPVGGGTYWNDGYHQMIKKVRSRVGEDAVLTTESCCETYIDVLDMMLVLDQDFITFGSTVLGGMKYQQSVPLFNFIYGDYSICYGTSNHFDIPFDIYRYTLIRNMLWGIVPTIEGVTAKQLERDDIYQRFDILKEVTSFYNRYKNKLFYGRPVQIPKVDGQHFTLTLPCGLHGDYTINIPKILPVMWEKGEERFYIGYNFSDEKEKAKIGERTFSNIPCGFFML